MAWDISILSPALMTSPIPPSLMRRPLPSVRVRMTRRFMNRPSLVLLSTSGWRLPSPAVVIWLSATPYFTKNALTATGETSAVARGGDLVVGYAILHQKRFDGIGPLERELLIICGRTHVIRVAGDLHAVIAMLAQLVRQPQQAGVPVGKNRGIEFEIDLFPVFLGLTARLKPLGKQTRGQ